MKAELFVDAHATIAESLLWEPDEGTLYWADIKQPALYRTDPRTLATQGWDLPEDIGAFTLLGCDDALLALRSGLYALTRLRRRMVSEAARFFMRNSDRAPARA